MDAFDAANAANLKTEATRLTVECWRLSGVKAVAKNWASHVVSNDPDQAFFLSSASIWPLGFSASPFASQSGIFASSVAMENCLYSNKLFATNLPNSAAINVLDFLAIVL